MIKIILKTGQTDIYEAGKVSGDGCGGTWVTLPNGTRVTYRSDNILKRIEDAETVDKRNQDFLRTMGDMSRSFDY